MPGPSSLTVWLSRNQMVSIGLLWRSASVPAMQTWKGYGFSTQWVEFSSILLTLANTPLVRFLWILGLLPSCLVCHLENCKLAHLRHSSLRPQTMETNGVTKWTTWVIHVVAHGSVLMRPTQATDWVCAPGLQRLLPGSIITLHMVAYPP